MKFLQHGTLVGLLPVPHPILIRKYQANSGTTTWFRTYMWGVIYLRLVSWKFITNQGLVGKILTFQLVSKLRKEVLEVKFIMIYLIVETWIHPFGTILMLNCLKFNESKRLS